MWRRLAVRTCSSVLLASAGMSLAFVACDSTPGRTTQCSNGPAWTAESIPHAGKTSASSAPECFPRCGAEQKYTYVGIEAYAIDALPSGACAHEDETCTMGAGTTAQCPGRSKELCNYSGYECRCQDGSWRCAVVSQGAGTCGGCGDAGKPPVVVDTPDADAGPAAEVNRAATPTFSPEQGTYTNARCVTITTATPGASIHFTDDGTIPTAASPVFADALPLGVTTTIRAVAIAPGLDPSDVAIATFVFNKTSGPSAPTTFSPASGTFDGGVSVTLATATVPSLICYTLDGAVPTCSVSTTPSSCASPPSPASPPSCTGYASPYVAPIQLVPPPNGGTVEVRALVCTQYGRSDITEATYVFPPP